MKIAVYGTSATGKTAIASELANKLRFELRSCGEIVKKITNQLGLSSPSKLNIHDHKLIDSETKNVVLTTNNIIIEGRYLNFVLYEIKDVKFIELICSPEERKRRILKRDFPNSIARLKNIDIEKIDKEDQKLIHSLYGEIEPKIIYKYQIDTTNYSVVECVDIIIQECKKQKCLD